ncbi:8-oxo-dGTP pyrophosphatase MutT (NUDIX family) [Myroides gitamensis]|uniref:NUDIX hydrolase n=1 Tax=Myroides odoratus TaxID=256 RepID=UPI0021678D01|nr:NUDIX domain-containing protein [Myroides odoratus]MCS4238375.1 8-oxo-dGTP pyrophosphatase MutT (NUDIX family) [Myroides odoratus]MDH6600818.1 8-oxo-dGTP pyrophosphatase MutT (NUDIX family) [Myroides gitamensis]
MSPQTQLHIVQATPQHVPQIQDLIHHATQLSYTLSHENTKKNKNIAELIHQKEMYLVYEEEILCGCFVFNPQGYAAALVFFYCLADEKQREIGQEQVKWNMLLEAVQKQACVSSFSYLTVIVTPAMQAWYEKRGARQSKVVEDATDAVEYYLTVVDQPWIDLPTAGLVCVKDNQLLLAFSKNKQAWYLPGGKIDAGEDSQQALRREIEEELSLVLQPERLSFLTHIVAPAYGEKKNILMQQDCYYYELEGDTITIANEIGGIQYFTKEEYIRDQIPVPGVLKVFEYCNL